MQASHAIEADLARLSAALHHQDRLAPAARNVNARVEATFSPLDRFAIVVTDKVGTMGFFLIIFTWTVLWLGWNMLAPEQMRFDPYPAFVLWLFISNLLQLHLMPLIMVGQNLQGRHDELRADTDFAVNQKAEAETQRILDLLEHQRQLIEYQGTLLVQLVRRLEGTDPLPPGAAPAGK